MMLSTRPEEQLTLFKEITVRKISVREAERIARRIAVDKVRKKQLIPNTELLVIEQKLQETLGTRVHIEPREQGGKITIDYFSPEDLDTIMQAIHTKEQSMVPQVVVVEEELETKTLADDRDKQEIRQAEEDIDELYNIKNFSL